VLVELKQIRVSEGFELVSVELGIATRFLIFLHHHMFNYNGRPKGRIISESPLLNIYIKIY
jgi:hypothetical protein